MGCGCRSGNGAGRGGSNDTLGYYVVMPDGSMRPKDVNPDAPESGAPPFLMYAEAHNEVIGVGGTIHRLRRKRR